MNNNPKITIVDADDWMGLYIDGKCRRQAHNITIRDVLDYLEVDYTYGYVDLDWMGDRESLPEELSEIVLEEE